MKPLALSALFFLLSIAPAHADTAAPSYVELADAPTIAVDWSKGSVQFVTLGGNRTFTFSNGQKGGKYTLAITQDATGSRMVTWPSSVHWPGDSPPTLTTTANKKDYVTFFYNGTGYDAFGLTSNL